MKQKGPGEQCEQPVTVSLGISGRLLPAALFCSTAPLQAGLEVVAQNNGITSEVSERGGRAAELHGSGSAVEDTDWVCGPPGLSGWRIMGLSLLTFSS